MAKRGRPPGTPAERMEAAQLQKHLGELMQHGAEPWFFEIRRRRPGTFSFPHWRRSVPCSSIPDVAAFCYGEGGPQYEYRVTIKDGRGREALRPDGEPVGTYELPATTDADPSSAGDDPLKLEEEELKRLEKEAALKRRRANIQRDLARIEKQLAGDDEDEDDEPANPYGSMMGPYGMPMWMMMNPALNPFMQRGKDSTVELLTALVPVFTAMISRREKNPLEDAALLRLLVETGSKGNLNPKEMFGMLAPMVTEMGKVSAESQKAMMAGMADADRGLRERMLNLIMADPNRSEDDIDKFKRVLNLVGDGLERGVGMIRNVRRGKGKKPVEIPVEGKETPKTVEHRTVRSTPAKESAPADPEKTPAQRAREIVAERVKTFLGAIEEESLVGSAPVAVANRLDELYLLLPETLRFKFRAMDTAAIFETLRAECPEIVERILAAVTDDKSMALQRWYEEFWDEMARPSEDEEEEGGDDDEGGEEGEPETEPEPQAPGGEKTGG